MDAHVCRAGRNRAKLSKELQLRIFGRDRWLCAWCGRPVIFGPAFKLISKDLRAAGHSSDLAYYHPNWTRAHAPLLDELGAVLDHINPFASGGACAENNLVAACSRCNMRKSDNPVELWANREKRKPVKGKYGDPQAWDGLSSIYLMLAERHCENLTGDERAWLAALLKTGSSNRQITREKEGT